MRLIHIRTLELEEFIEGSIPPYAILSHRWSSEELTFKEVSKKRIDVNKKGYSKLLGACRMAAKHNVSFIWVDTFCIDKRSSAELSEAINSMCVWYRNAKVCIAYLEDVESGHRFEDTFRHSVWFTRSWTLQELLAPEVVEFYSGDWMHVGGRALHATMIMEVTGIDRYAINSWDICVGCSIAEKMSWAADRKATRTEDVAYSLMGIFGINMPLLYGEGEKAFTRLQQELLRSTDDTTVFLWGPHDSICRLLASSPADFREQVGMELRSPFNYSSVNIMSVGLEIETRLLEYGLQIYGIHIASQEGGNKYVLLLRKLNKANVYRKVGIIRTNPWMMRDVPQPALCKAAIAWENEGQLDEELEREQHKAEAHGFCVKLGQEMSILRPTKVRFGCQGPIKVRFGDQKYENHRDYIYFHSPIRRSVAKLEIRIGGHSTLIIDLFFDLDSNACALIYKDEPNRDTWATVDTMEASNPDIPSDAKCEMLEYHDPAGGPRSNSFLLRSGSRSLRRDIADPGIYAKVPLQLLSRPCSIWACFALCRSHQDDDFPCWTFRISNRHPEGYSDLPDEDHQFPILISRVVARRACRMDR